MIVRSSPRQPCLAGDRRARRAPRVAALGAALVALFGCASPTTVTDPPPTSADNEAEYAALYPYYAETCALSQIEKKPGFGTVLSGGVGGHDVLFLHGACRQPEQDYPSLALCDDLTPRPAADGVGVTVNGHFRNAMWVAVEGRNFFFDGSLAPGQGVTRATYRTVQARAQAMKIFDPIDFHEEYFDDMPPDFTRADYRYEISIATDYAISFARNRYCARVPLSAAQMRKSIAYLNTLNEPYRTGQQIFDWNVLSRNCSHVNHNTLAAAGVWFYWPMDRFVLVSAFDFPVPKNEFVNLMERTNDRPIHDPEAMFKDQQARAMLLNEARLPTAPGAIADLGVLRLPNDLYVTKSRIIFYDEALTGSFQRRFDAILSQPRYFRLRDNLQHFAYLYQKIAAERLPVETYLARHPGIPKAEADEFKVFYRRYLDYIDEQIRVVHRDLELLDQRSP